MPNHEILRTFATVMMHIPLFLSDVGGSEILLILVFILVFFGSKSIPGIARTMGRTIRQIKDASQEVQNEIRKSGADMKADMNLNRIVSDARESIEEPFRDHAKTMDQALNEDPRIKPPKSFVPPPQPMDQPMDQPLDQQFDDSQEESQKDETTENISEK